VCINRGEGVPQQEMLSAIWGSIMAALAGRVQPALRKPTAALGGSGGLAKTLI